MRRFFVLSVIAFVVVVSPTGASSASADTLGQSEEFRINDTFDALGEDRADFTLRAVGTHGYFYVDDRYWSSLSSSLRAQFLDALTDVSAEFDAVVYPRTIALWGDVANPGVDGDPRIVVVLQRLVPGSGGYFETIHNYTKDRAPQGNGREMIFVNVESVLQGSAERLTAHELQHLTSFQQKELTFNTREDVWLNEARSEYNVTAVGYSQPFEGSTLQRRMQSFLRTPSDSLTEWLNSATDYSIVSLFIHYLADRYGPSLVSSTVHTALVGSEAIDAGLAQRGTQRFGDVFTDWMVATYLNDGSIDAAYAYAQPGLTELNVQPMATERLSDATSQVAFQSELTGWEPLWVAARVSTDSDRHDRVTVRIDGKGNALWRGAVMATYDDGQTAVTEFTPTTAYADTTVPTSRNGADLDEIAVAVTHGNTESLRERIVADSTVTVSMALGSIVGDRENSAPTSIVSGATPSDGDLIRRPGQEEVYVVWGQYRRHLTKGILELYGFQNRPVMEVGDDVFFSYRASNYIRAEGSKPVYAVWPDGTKHWLNITADQWNASRRDWGAIFTVNDLEVAAYATGPNITQ